MKAVRPWTLILWLVAPVASQPPAGGVVTLPVDGTEDLTGSGRAFIEVSLPRDTCFVQEAIELRLRLGVENQFLETGIVQLFHRRLGVPVQVQAPWFEKLPEDKPGSGASFAFSDTVAVAPLEERTIAGRQFKVLEITRTYLPESPGELVVAAPILRFAYATRFLEDFVKGRVPVDRRDALVRGKPLTLKIQPLPTRGRPPEFTGAVGRFTVSADAHPNDVRVGKSFKLVLHIEGRGNMASFDPPRLDNLKGFHVLGKVDDKGRTARTITYDMAPLSVAQDEVPAIRLAFFDPGPPPGYHTVETSSVPLKVRPLRHPELLANDKANGAVPGVNDIFDIKHGNKPAPARPSPTLWWVLVLSPWLLALAMWLWWRGRVLHKELDQGQVREAAAIFRRGTQVPEAFARFLAELLDCSAAAVITPDLETRLETRGVPPDLATQAASLLEELFAERYGGSVSAGGEDAARALVDAMEAAFK